MQYKFIYFETHKNSYYYYVLKSVSIRKEFRARLIRRRSNYTVFWGQGSIIVRISRYFPQTRVKGMVGWFPIKGIQGRRWGYWVEDKGVFVFLYFSIYSNILLLRRISRVCLLGIILFIIIIIFVIGHIVSMSSGTWESSVATNLVFRQGNCLVNIHNHDQQNIKVEYT